MKKYQNFSEIPVVILCGGKGTRLKEETEFKPKPMVYVGNRPMLWHIMKIYSSFGLSNFMLCLGYKGNMLKEYFTNYEWNHHDVLIDLKRGSFTKLSNNANEEDWKIWLIDTGEETMTGGRLRKIKPYLERQSSDIFCVTYGDGVADINISDLIQYHLDNGKLATVTAVRPASRFGELKIENNLVTSFIEKPQTSDGWINGGFFVLNRKVLDLIDHDNTVFEAEPLKKLAAMTELSVYHHSGFWQCMDTYRELELLNSLSKYGKAPWEIWK